MGAARVIAPGSEVSALRVLFGELLGDSRTVRHLAGTLAGADLRYPMGGSGAHPWTGRWAPDLELDTADGPVRLAELTTGGRPLLLDLTEDGTPADEAADWHDRVDTLQARLRGAAGVTGLLLRPDCHVAWASAAPRPDAQEREELHAALSRWFGAPLAVAGRAG